MNNIPTSLNSNTKNEVSNKKIETDQKEMAKLKQSDLKEPAKEASPELKEKKITQVVAKLNDYVQSFQRDIEFTVDESSGEMVVTVLDSMTKEEIRQIPSEEALALAERLIEFETLSEENQSAIFDTFV